MKILVGFRLQNIAVNASTGLNIDFNRPGAPLSTGSGLDDLAFADFLHRVSSINDQCGVLCDKGMVIRRMVCRDQNTVVLPKVLFGQRDRLHLEVIFPRFFGFRNIWVVVVDSCAVGAEKLDELQ